jgi:nitrate reductase assembly molybdenum cofactor insertion protein NarJ
VSIPADLKTGQLLAQAAAWRLASLLLERPRPEWKSEIAKLRNEVADRRLASCAKRAACGTEEIYHRIFGPAGAVSPREVSYCGFEDPGGLMAELASFYHAFSFQPRGEEPADHISVEGGFVAYLFLKEAYAQMRGDAESIEVTKKARQRFTDEHVGRCARGMIARLSDGPPYIREVLLWLAEPG